MCQCRARRNSRSCVDLSRVAHAAQDWTKKYFRGLGNRLDGASTPERIGGKWGREVYFRRFPQATRPALG